MQNWLKCSKQAISLTLYIQPGAKKTELGGEFNGALKIRLAAPPVDGKANTALIHWLAERFSVAKRDIILLSGDKSRHKVVAIAIELDEAAVLHYLGLPE